ncbi:MAG: hypothetical protein K9N52_09900 [Verrucomicrobia bacterium]|nr:hypothetical protein [Verrucomicrobiota bacterium]
MKRCLYPLGGLFYSLFGWAIPGLFKGDLEVVNTLGMAQSSYEFRSELNKLYTYNRMNRNSLKQRLLLRVSTRELRKLLSEVYPEHMNSRWEQGG